MQVATGTGIGGKVVAEGRSLSGGTSVPVVTREGEATIRPSPRDKAELLESLNEADHTVGIAAEELFERLRRFG